MKTRFILFLLLYTAIHLSGQDFSIRTYNIDIRVAENGHFDVVEEIQVEFFRNRRGIIRNIPYQYKVEGKRKKIIIHDLRVDGWKYQTYRENGNDVIRIGDPDVYLNGIQNYVIRYRVEDAFLVFKDHIEFYWNVIGEEWDSEIEQVNFNIHFPKEEEIQEYKLFAGNRRSDHGKIMVSQDGSDIIGRSLRTLNPHEGVSIAVKLPRYAIHLSSDLTRSIQEASEELDKSKKADWFSILPASLILFFFGWWRRKGRNDYSFEPLKDVYYAPDSVSAAEAGSRIDFRVHERDLLALIPQWGREGFIKITGPYEMGRYSSPDLFVERLQNLPPNFPEHEQILFSSLFQDGDIVLLNSLKNKFYTHFQRAKKALKQEMNLRESYDPASYRVFHSGWFLGIGLVCIIAGIYLMVGHSMIYSGITLLVLFTISWFIHFSSPKKTEEALRTQQALRDFEWFLEKGPEDKLRDLVDKDPNYFENVFPYVVAFGIDKAFVKRIEPYMETGPSWYYYGDLNGNHDRAPFRTFSDQFNVHSVSSAFTSVPGSSGSGSSTSFSSGSSGGGFGGGGGSSW
jgi:uncharacterized membrane protein YgcG